MKSATYKIYRIVMDLDLTLCGSKPESGDYLMCEPRADVIAKLREYHARGYYIIIQSARQMNTYANSIGEINVHTLPVVLEWLKKHDVPYDEVLVGKPWCGHRGFYVDDRAIRPSEFTRLSPSEVETLLTGEEWK